MPRQTQTYPRSLIDLLQLKDSSPFPLADEFRGAIELIDILGSDRVTVFNVTTATVGSGSADTQLPMSIPDGQIWIMVAAGAQLIGADVGNVAQLRLQHNRKGRRGPPFAVGPKQETSLGGERVEVGHQYPRPVILLPGDALIARILFTGSGGPVTVNLWAEYYRFGPESLGSAL